MTNARLTSYAMYMAVMNFAGIGVGLLLPNSFILGKGFLVTYGGLLIAGYWVWKPAVIRAATARAGTGQIVAVSAPLKSYVLFVVIERVFYLGSGYLGVNEWATQFVWVVVLGYWVWCWILSKTVVATPTAQEKEIDAIHRITLNLWGKTADQDVALRELGDAPPVLEFQLPDSRFRHLIFCLSAVLTRCAQRMKDPDATFNECASKLIHAAIALAGSDSFLAAPVDPKKTTDEGTARLKDLLDRWSAWIEIEQRGGAEDAISLVCSMMHEAESETPTTEDDRARLWPLACWVVGQMDEKGAINKGFIELTR